MIAASSGSPAGFASAGPIQLNLAFFPDWRHIRHAREVVFNLVLAVVGDPAFAERCGMCASELLENAVKYAVPQSEIDVRVELRTDSMRLRIEVENEATPDNAAALQRMLDKLTGGEPMDAYLELLREVAEREGLGSHVGLGRVRAEGRAEMAFGGIHDNRVRLTAVVPRTVPPAPPAPDSREGKRRAR